MGNLLCTYTHAHVCYASGVAGHSAVQIVTDFTAPKLFTKSQEWVNDINVDRDYVDRVQGSDRTTTSLLPCMRSTKNAQYILRVQTFLLLPPFLTQFIFFFLQSRMKQKTICVHARTPLHCTGAMMMVVATFYLWRISPVFSSHIFPRGQKSGAGRQADRRAGGLRRGWAPSGILVTSGLCP